MSNSYPISMDEQKIANFIDYASKLSGYEKGEAHLFLDRLFIAFGNQGILEAGASLEKQITINMKTKFCDLLWPNVVLIEMKSRGAKLADHFDQAKTYWDNTYGNRPKYVVLCNFDEFWIYNWNLQREPLDKVRLLKLNDQWRSLAFLCPTEIKPLFGNNLVVVTEQAADKIAQLYKSLVERKIDRIKARRYSLQCLVSLFAEDTGLFPDNTMFTALIDECRNGQSTYNLFKELFEQMNSKDEATGGKFKGVRYFNGGIFSQIYQLELTKSELDILWESSHYDWSKVQPSIFGTIFEDSLGKEERHLTGAHFTLLSEIMSVVEPTILRPWRERIDAAKTLRELNQIHDDMSRFRVLDPACGSGNFLYIAYRELRFLEIILLKRMVTDFPSVSPTSLHSKIRCSQFFGIDVNPLGIELAKVTLSMAKKLTTEEFNKFTKQNRFYDETEDPLPFDNLDNNFIQGDALFVEWPKADVIIGNPPYQSKNKMQEEFGAEYVNRLRENYPNVDGRSDYCVYWFRKAHDELEMEGRAGLVGTNTIRQTFSRKSGLDYIVSNDGIITEAISSMPWAGSAVVHVSIVNWIKTKKPQLNMKRLRQKLGETGNEPWEEYELSEISSSLSPKYDVTKAQKIHINILSEACFQGQTHGHEGFLLNFQERERLVQLNPAIKEVTFPYLIAEELIGTLDSLPTRYVIDFGQRDLYSSKKYKEVFDIIEKKVLTDRQAAFEKEKSRNFDAISKNPNAKVNHHHEHFLDRWWQLSYAREKLINRISAINRFIVCGQVTKRPIFEFISSNIRPNAALIAFPLNDDYSFGILQSCFHWEWFKATCSSLKDDPRYTSSTVFDSFPWPQWGITESWKDPDDVESFDDMIEKAERVAIFGRELREVRNKLKFENKCSLRELYRDMEKPGKNPLKMAHDNLDKAVREIYSFEPKKKPEDELRLLYKLNLKCSALEMDGKNIFGPGLPKFCKALPIFYSADCVDLSKIN